MGQRYEAQHTQTHTHACTNAYLCVCVSVVYLVWAFVPDATLRDYGFTYYPSKHWALALPAMVVVTYVFSIVFYKSINLLTTPTLDSYETVTGKSQLFTSAFHLPTKKTHLHKIADGHAVYLPQSRWHAQTNATTPAIADLQLTDVNDHLFG